jgi:hypothetical protein
VAPTALTVPRARLRTEAGTTDWQSAVVPPLSAADRAGRRNDPRRVFERDELATSSRSAGPLLKGGPLSKDAVSRLVGRLKGDFDLWRSRNLAEACIRYVLADGWIPRYGSASNA